MLDGCRTSSLWDHGSQLGVGNAADDREDAAGDPNDEGAANGSGLHDHTLGRDEDATSDDETDEQRDTVAKAQILL